jgi:hypothetical protein
MWDHSCTRVVLKSAFKSENARRAGLNITSSGTYEIDGTSFTVNLAAGAPNLISLNDVSLNPAEADSFLQLIFGGGQKAIPLGSLLTWSVASGLYLKR